MHGPLTVYICAWYITTATCFIYTIVYIWLTKVMHVYIVYGTHNLCMFHKVALFFLRHLGCKIQ